ncbi:tyrosine-type recombinase/integrase [Cryobacterium sp. M91]|uniref:tyrosine-type recombinase/integrase n=1 Tax=Cryobacterium sp. M91 TaxID=2048294 RepID=UPI0035159E2C
MARYGPTRKVKDVVRSYISSRESDADSPLAAKTVRSYRGALKNHILHKAANVGAVSVTKLDAPSVTGWLSDLKRAGVTDSSRKYARGLLAAALSWETENGGARFNAAAALRTRSTKASRAKRQTGNDILIPSWQELTELALNPAERADRLLIMLMAWGGLRWSEAIGLDIQSMNPEAGTIAITQVFIKSETRGWVIEPVKAGVSESVTLPTRLLTALLDHADGHPHERNSLTGRLLFRAPRPRPGSHELLDLSNWTRNVFKPARIAAGLNGDMTRPTLDPRRRHLTPKDLRASAASFLIDAGASRLETSAHLRHGDPRTTDRYYSRPLESQHHSPARASIRANTALSLPERLSAMFEAWIETDPERLKNGLM